MPGCVIVSIESYLDQIKFQCARNRDVSVICADRSDCSATSTVFHCYSDVKMIVSWGILYLDRWWKSCRDFSENFKSRTLTAAAAPVTQFVSSIARNQCYLYADQRLYEKGKLSWNICMKRGRNSPTLESSLVSGLSVYEQQ